MPRRAFLTFVIIAMCSAAVADGTIELPARSNLVQLKIKVGDNRFESIEIPEVRSRKISLAPGEYQYTIKLKSALGNISGSATVEDGGHVYIHRANSPDGKKVASWASASRPRSEQYEIEAKERFCLGIIGTVQQETYMLDSCSELGQLDNAVGLYGLGYMHEKGATGTLQSSTKASDYYMRAYKQGHQDAGAAYFILNQERDGARDVLFELADGGHVWAVGAAGRLLSMSESPDDRQRSRSYADKSLVLGDPAGFRTRSQLAFTAVSENPNEIIEAAAWFNLYNMHQKTRDFNARRFKGAIADLLLSDDEAAIRQRTIELEKEYLSAALYLQIDTAVLAPFKDRGRLTLTLGNDFTMPVSDYETRYVLPLWPSKSSYSVTLNIDDEYVDSTTFHPEDKTEGVLCLVVRPDDLAMRSSSSGTGPGCSTDSVEAESIWSVLDQYM